MFAPKKTRMSSDENKEPAPVPGESRHSVWIHELNDDCLVRMFQYLSLGDRLTAETVCRRWKRVVKLAWYDMKHLNLTESTTCSTDFDRLPVIYRNNQSIATILLRCGRYLDQLTIGKPCHYTMLPFVAEHCQNLTRLETNFEYYEHEYQNIQTMPKLKYFGTISGDFDDDILQALPSNSLVEIHLEGSHENINDYDDDNRTQLPGMSSIYFENLENLSVISIHEFGLFGEILEVISAKSKLTFLRLASCFGPFHYLTFGSTTNLEHLDLENVPEVDDIHISQVSETCKKLKYLNVGYCDYVTDEGLSNLRKLPKLEELRLDHTDDITDVSFSRLHQLKKLSCEGCKMVGDEGVITLMRSAVGLEYLNLLKTGVTKEVLNVANEICKQRTNGVPLRVLVDSSLAENWNERNSLSLIIETQENTINPSAIYWTANSDVYDRDMYDDHYQFEYDYGSDASTSDDEESGSESEN